MVKDKCKDTSYLNDEKFLTATNIDTQKNSFSAHWSLLNYSQSAKILKHFAGMKLEDLNTNRNWDFYLDIYTSSGPMIIVAISPLA